MPDFCINILFDIRHCHVIDIALTDLRDVNGGYDDIYGVRLPNKNLQQTLHQQMAFLIIKNHKTK